MCQKSQMKNRVRYDLHENETHYHDNSCLAPHASSSEGDPDVALSWFLRFLIIIVVLTMCR